MYTLGFRSVGTLFSLDILACPKRGLLELLGSESLWIAVLGRTRGGDAVDSDPKEENVGDWMVLARLRLFSIVFKMLVNPDQSSWHLHSTTLTVNLCLALARICSALLLSAVESPSRRDRSLIGDGPS